MMNEQDSAQAVQPEAEELQVEVVDQIETDEAKAESVSSEDELENYTKGVSKRINKLNERNRAAEEKAARLEQMLAQKEMETASMLQKQQATAAQLLVKEEEALESKQLQADDLYKKAIQSNDAELISKADTLKSDLSIQKEKLKVAKQQAEQQNFQNPQLVQQPEQNVQQQTAQPPATEEAKAWLEENPWYADRSDPTNAQAADYAYFTHFLLANEGYELDSDEYYNELNKRVFKVYPDLQKSDNVEQSHNMTEDAWLKSVAKEKQKIANREAK